MINEKRDLFIRYFINIKKKRKYTLKHSRFDCQKHLWQVRCIGKLFLSIARSAIDDRQSRLRVTC